MGFALGGALGIYRGFEPSARTAAGEYSASTAVGYLGLLGALVVGLLAAGGVGAVGKSSRSAATADLECRLAYRPTISSPSGS